MPQIRWRKASTTRAWSRDGTLSAATPITDSSARLEGKKPAACRVEWAENEKLRLARDSGARFANHRGRNAEPIYRIFQRRFRGRCVQRFGPAGGALHCGRGLSRGRWRKIDALLRRRRAVHD